MYESDLDFVIVFAVFLMLGFLAMAGGLLVAKLIYKWIAKRDDI